MRYHIDTIPVWDAAKIDGECLLCALQRRVELQQIEYSLGASVTRIIFPMAKPSIITIILFNFLSFWNEYIISMTLMSSTNAPRTLPVGLLNLMQAQQSAAQYGTMYAGLVLVMLPTLILYICVQKQLTQGMTVGGLKG